MILPPPPPPLGAVQLLPPLIVLRPKSRQLVAVKPPAPDTITSRKLVQLIAEAAPIESVKVPPLNMDVINDGVEDELPVIVSAPVTVTVAPATAPNVIGPDIVNVENVVFPEPLMYTEDLPVAAGVIVVGPNEILVLGTEIGH